MSIIISPYVNLSGATPFLRAITNIDQLPETLVSGVAYVIHGRLDTGNRTFKLPTGFIQISGLGLGVSGLYSTEDNYTMFESAVGGCGTIFVDNINLTASGTSSKLLNITGSTGLEAFEANFVNFEDCTDIGTITNFRQYLEFNTGRFGGTPTLEFAGTWIGGASIKTSLTANLDPTMTDPLFKAGAGLTFGGRWITDMNVDHPVNASFADFSSSNFTSPSSFRIIGARFTRNGVTVSGDNNYLPNLNPDDLVCAWKDNDGLRNTYEGGRLDLTSESTNSVASTGTFYDIVGTFTPVRLDHFSSPSNGLLRNDAVNPIEFNVRASLIIESNPNDSLSIKVVKWDDSASGFTDVYTQPATVNALSGSRDVAIVSLDTPISLEQNDYVKLQIANLTGAKDFTVEVGSYIQVKV